MSDLGRVLIAGTGPTSVQFAVMVKSRLDCAVGIAGRESVRSTAFFADLERNGRTARVDVQNDKHSAAAGECPVDELFRDYEAVTGEWRTLVLTVTADAYTQVLRRIDHGVLSRISCVVLVSPTFGSNSLVRNYLRGRGVDAEVISFSSYLGDTRWMDGAPSHHVLTAAVKKKLYIGSSRGRSENLDLLCDMHRRLGVAMGVVNGPMEAETRNISLYVHPALFMNEISLNTVFFDAEPTRYVYKLVPEGPITPSMVREMVNQWKEVTAIVGKMGIKGVNLLRFMVDDSYPVRPESISRQDVELFEGLPPVHQEYLVYVRYASLLVDPFSEPDADGRYFDFSAIPIRRVFVDGEGRWDVPRMPKEDYYRTKVIQGVARHLGVDCPTIDEFLGRYERALGEAAGIHAGEPLTDAFEVRDFREDLDMICEEITKAR
ncbi:opine metallophore biosynthesis dehydrogenase [Umezawaea sp. Da 62-37]|uniref:opine metallophore biosynthesis dehydrogenase n=1 Tax=Umezawaea sp. Da 62-37 TaxID=3075927 RepID=UPI0028F73D16|nr:opine metallophore biosynthesis dehydrogenase [Umezawaea sp. Da 62-37]WNV87590.1 opine metallophore biosynthesis dehydrogenase [Umezawaea sp. Da 62-37]